MRTMSSHVGEKIKLIRSKLGLSQAKFCEMLDFGIGGLKNMKLVHQNLAIPLSRN